jgi:hypothetical protein
MEAGQTSETSGADDPVISLKEFLETTPPGKVQTLNDNVTTYHSQYSVTPSYYITLPTIQLYCSSENCQGERYFAPSDRTSDNLSLNDPDKLSNEFITYSCKNCGGSEKIYALSTRFEKKITTNVQGKLLENKIAKVAKVGELPAFGPPTPSRVLSLIGPDRDNFFKGRRAESQGLGVGAFAYYRKIVENHKNRIFDELIKVCKKTGDSDELVTELENAKEETQFTKAVESIKHGIPATLLINGQHNPLVLLHSALSEGIHEHSDEECLGIAQSIRLVLTEFADRISQVLKEAKELDSAISKLMQKKQTPGKAR